MDNHHPYYGKSPLLMGNKVTISMGLRGSNASPKNNTHLRGSACLSRFRRFRRSASIPDFYRDLVEPEVFMDVTWKNAGCT